MDCTAELTQKPFITPHKETNNFCFTADHKQIEQRHPDHIHHHILGPRGGHGGLERGNHIPGGQYPGHSERERQPEGGGITVKSDGKPLYGLRRKNFPLLKKEILKKFENPLTRWSFLV